MIDYTTEMKIVTVNVLRLSVLNKETSYLLTILTYSLTYLLNYLLT